MAGSYATSSGLMGGADALQNYLAQRKMEEIAAQQAAAAAQQKQFENQVLALKTQSGATKDYADAQRALRPDAGPAPEFKDVTTEGPGGTKVLRGFNVRTGTLGDPLGNAPADKVTKNIEPWTLRDGSQVMAYQDESGHLIDSSNQHVVDPNTIANKTPQPTYEAPDVKRARDTQNQIAQGQLNISQRQQSDRTANIAAHTQAVMEGGESMNEVPSEMRGDVLRATQAQGGAPTQLSQQGKGRKELAQTLLPKYEQVMELAQQINQMGLQGSVGSRWQKLVSGESSAAELSGLTPEQKQTVGKFVSEARGLLISGTAMVHGGARGGGSPMLLEQMKQYLDPGNKDLDVYLGMMQGAQNFIGGYASMAERPVVSPQPPANPRPGTLWQPPNSQVTMWTGRHWVPVGG